MLITFPLLDASELADARALLGRATWIDGRGTAGPQAAGVKNNQQIPVESEESRALQALIVRALDRSPQFLAAALPRKVFPPRFNRYGGATNAYGQHVDSAIRFTDNGMRVRTDLSCTVFLCEPNEYEGGELVMVDAAGERTIKLAAGHAVLYPGTTVHEVRPVTRGARLASFLWIESMVRSHEQRQLLFELDAAITGLRALSGESPSTVALTGTYHNLLRMWADT